jgi:hypothetical protein
MGNTIDDPNYQVFVSAASFRAWELCVELRANVDYLIELNELMRYEKRQQERKKNDSNVEINNDNDDSFDSVDFMKLLSPDGLDSILRTILSTFSSSSEQLQNITMSIQQRVKSDVEKELSTCQNNLTERENILITVAIAATHILQTRGECIDKDEAAKMVSRPWLRHLWWEGCLAYMLWDIIPICERCELYSLAIQALRVLIHGCIVDGGETADEGGAGGGGSGNPLAPLLLSRRARGKAMDRLVIDKTHLDCRLCNGQQEKALQKQVSIDGAAKMTETDNATKRYSDWIPITDKKVANALGTDRDAVGSRCVFVGHDDTASVNVEQLAMECYRTGRVLFPKMAPVIMRSKGAGWDGMTREFKFVPSFAFCVPHRCLEWTGGVLLWNWQMTPLLRQSSTQSTFLPTKERHSIYTWDLA